LTSSDSYRTKPRDSGVLKIGALAEAAGESVATIRHWTKAGLLEVAASGYQLFAADMVGRCKEIRRMQGERLTLKEIAGRVL
jgi:DNA-binding transcriptional MerR regulator